MHEQDTEHDLLYCCKRLLGCKLWENDDGRPWRQHVKQKSLELLMVSQFTLYGTLTKKNQPDYKYAMKSEPAQQLYARFLSMLRENYAENKIQDGVFGAMMDVQLVNDGPVTIIIESRKEEQPSSEQNSDDNGASNPTASERT